MIYPTKTCACGCNKTFTPRFKDQQFINRKHSNNRKDKPPQTGLKKHPKRCGHGRAGITI